MGSASSTSKSSLQSPRSQNSKASKDAANKAASKEEKKASHNKTDSKDNKKSHKDVMISYSHADKDFMLKIKQSLEENGITVWVDVTGLKAGVDFLSKIGQAIIDSKMIISLLSASSVKSKYCQDELALAYVSNKDIFPIGMCPPDVLYPEMTTGMKLQLARFNWHLFVDEERYESSVSDLVAAMNVIKRKMTEEVQSTPPPPTDGKKSRSNVNKKFSKKLSFLKKVSDTNEGAAEEGGDFWRRNFDTRKAVTWNDFERLFREQYGKYMDMVFNKEDQEWLKNILRRELRVDESESVLLDDYLDFVTVDEIQEPFWSRVQDQALESYTMKEVFNMDSSVRVEAIENLGKFNSPSVVEALLDLLSDKDKNVQAVAAISLARTEDHSEKVVAALMKCLTEKDRLVRESACLALGHLQAEQAITKLVHLWRNDFISSVRDAAQIALEQIGGPEADKAMHITKVLSEEIRALTKD